MSVAKDNEKMQVFLNSHSCQILPAPTPLKKKEKKRKVKGLLCSPLPLVNNNGSSSLPTPHFSTQLLTCPHRFQFLGSG